MTELVFYFMLGIGTHSEAMDCPEVCFGGNTLAKIEFGMDYRLSSSQFLVGQVMHISNPAIIEQGYGMNAVFVNYKFTF